MKSRPTFDMEFRRRIDGESTKMCPLDFYPFARTIEWMTTNPDNFTQLYYRN